MQKAIFEVSELPFKGNLDLQYPLSGRLDSFEEPTSPRQPTLFYEDLELGTLSQEISRPIVPEARCPERRIWASSQNDRIIRLWDLRTGAPLHTLFGHRERVTALAFMPGGRILGSAGQDGTVRFWDVNFGEEVLRLEIRGGCPQIVEFSRDGRYFVVWSTSKP